GWATDILLRASGAGPRGRGGPPPSGGPRRGTHRRGTHRREIHRDEDLRGTGCHERRRSGGSCENGARERSQFQRRRRGTEPVVIRIAVSGVILVQPNGKGLAIREVIGVVAVDVCWINRLRPGGR